MEFIIAALIFVIVGAVLAVVIILRTPRQEPVSEQIRLLQTELAEFKARQLENANRSLQDQTQFYQKSQGMLAAVHEKLGTLAKASEQITDLGKDIVGLQDILKAPKLRGGLGEYFLQDLLGQVLPEKNFETQYRFRDGTAVDAVVKVGEKIVPIDSKFPLESFQRMLASGTQAQKDAERKEFVKSVKKRIDEIASKYIKEEEGTYDFAMMYVPAENVYYETIITDNLGDRKYEISAYALEKKVIPVSPNSLYAYLMSIILGLKGFKIEQQAKLIMNELTKVQTRFADFYGDFTLIGRHLKNAENKYDETAKKAEKFNDQIGRVTGVKRDLLDGAEE